MTINSGFARPAQGGLSVVIPLRPGEPSPQSLAASRRRNVIMVVIGLAAACYGSAARYLGRLAAGVDMGVDDSRQDV